MAKDVITRFKLETTAFDSAIKQASKELSDYSKTATKAKEGFNQFTKSNVDAARALGTMATSSNNLKGKVQELVGAFNEAAKAYNQLTKEQQQSDFGKAMAQSLTTLQQRIKETKAELQGLGDVTKNISGGGLFGGGKLDGMLQVFGGNMMTKAAGFAAGLASEMGDMIQQGIELARQGEGIRNAFERLGRGDILDGLREATHGTVTDIELMKAAVKFNDFKLPVEELGTMLAFAQQKAKDTGQSVDYMVDSIVTGLGRKSLMILDNLGLSAAEIKEKMAETGDMTKAVGAIIREQMAKAGDYVETAADRAAQANVSLQNKMEELGRKFAPLQEASNNLWTSMKIGIMDIVGGPLTDFINKLTQAGRLASQYGVLGGSNKVARMTANLSGTREEDRQSIYQQQQDKFWRYINPREQQLKDIRAWQRGERGEALQGRISAITEKYGSLDATKIQAEVDAAKKMLADYQQAAKTILNPVKADIDTSVAGQNIDTLKKKLKELEEQRKKAIASGDTELSKNLLKQINQTKADIRGLDPKALTTSTSHKTTPQETAANKVEEAERTYTETLQKAAIRMEVGLDSALEGKKKELAAQERLFDAYNDAYAAYKDPKYKEASSDAADKIKALAAEVKSMTEAEEATKKAARELEAAQKKLTDAETKLAEAQATGSATAIYQAQQAVNKQRGVLDRMKNGTPAPTTTTGFEAMKQTITAEVKLERMQVDETTLHTILKDAVQHSINGMDLQLSGLSDQIAKGIDIPDKKWQEIIDEYNKIRQQIGEKPIEVDLKTGQLAKDGDAATKSWRTAASAINSASGAISNIEDPGAKILSTIGQAIATVALAYSESLAQTKEKKNIWAFIAAAAAATISMVSTISQIHSSTGYAEGGIVKGNTYSGDMIQANDGTIGLNAGEVVLNKAQQGVLASQLQGAGGNINLRGIIRGEDILVVADRSARRQGKGELLFWK